MASTDNPLDLSGHTVLVTGAGQGVGKRVAELAAARGAAIVVNDFDADRAAAVVDELRASGTTAAPAAADVGDFEQFGTAIDTAVAEIGPIDILVNNAGNRGAEAPAHAPRPFWEQDPSDWKPFFHVNLDGAMNATRHVLPYMIAGNYGRVITVISDAARVGEINGMESYSAAKAGAAGFTRSIARLSGRHGITANSVALGATRTPAIADAIADENFAKKVLSGYIIRRFGDPEDAANMILFLASGAAGWVTGQTIPVNGGYSLAL
ncbi:SDR family NAD(P)-dependent oxidoreductase [Hoyosella subflava]|uniref:3-oxoacyl-[acyl-carrier-protein] reductase MabA n=1 Tax=Hoyosella subflava (strain DSM 45089 / JCM 17490 / NBRC 109087 / DQS3-9A1) TaxID=443218 RepID=F6ELD5_HOYSD|nr:SDR family NAD(P)-dependent oxidoreductase [Hoyosella subflava]AEF39227.1 Putative short chain dehydrogenase [Hoyosella subflava DQS3-9A1]